MPCQFFFVLPQEGRNYHRLDETGRSLHLEGSVEPEGAPFGSAWESLGMNEPGACALANLLAPFWSPTFVARRTVLLLGDSNDFHSCAREHPLPPQRLTLGTSPLIRVRSVLNFLCSEYARRGFPDWHAYVYSHDAMNWCALPSGLTVLQLCLTGVLSGDVVHVHHAASFFGGAEKGFRGEGMGAEDEALRASQAKAIAALGPPDTVVLAASCASAAVAERARPAFRAGLTGAPSLVPLRTDKQSSRCTSSRTLCATRPA